MKYEIVVGLEVHAELNTKTKIYCGCKNSFGSMVNSNCCPICTGMPGTLPTLNKSVVDYAVRMGYALHCSINNSCKMDRKNYFYPDLPKAYQISQFDIPLCENGYIDAIVDEEGHTKRIGVTRIHIEEDAGKLIHSDDFAGSLVDFNRCGVPLIEIVTEPDMSSAAEAKAFVEKVSLLLQYAGVCDCKMEQGSIRADVNVSIMKPTDTEFGTRTEMKNLNSIKAIGRAIDFEIYRQGKLLDMGKKVIQETRRFDDNRGETKAMRSKENAHDYRYFPEPDILQVNFTDEQLDAIRNSLPELPAQRIIRYTSEFGLSESDAKILVANKILSDFFDAAVKTYNNPKSICNFINGELMRRINLGEITLENLPFTAEQLAKLVEMADTEKVSKNDAKDVFREMSEKGGDPEAIAKEKGLLISNDLGKVAEVIDKILSENEKAVAQYKGGDMKVFGFIMGQCTKALKGVCTPKVIKEELEKKLKS